MSLLVWMILLESRFLRMHQTTTSLRLMYADYQNALDLDDLTHYGLPPQTAIYLTVRNGLILPNIIEEDMTLTKDNYYIIPNSMIIQAGATVTVEPGTNIQFWTDDPNHLMQKLQSLI